VNVIELTLNTKLLGSEHGILYFEILKIVCLRVLAGNSTCSLTWHLYYCVLIRSFCCR